MQSYFKKGQNFAQWFIQSLNSDPKLLKKVLNKYSVISYNGKDFQGYNENKELKFIEFLLSDEMKKAKYMGVHVDVQPSLQNCILIALQGIVVPDESKPNEDKSFDSTLFIHLNVKNDSITLLNFVFLMSED